MTLLNEALRLAELGWQVFALGPTGFPLPNCRGCTETCTTPQDYDSCDHLICHGCYAGTTEVDRLTAMWEAVPHALLGVRTGLVSGLFVLDFDNHSADKDGIKSYQQMLAQGVLPRTVSARSGGGGIHLYYKHPGGSIPNDNRGKLKPGVDVKGEGGYVIAAPSAKRGKSAYSWVKGLSPFETGLAILEPNVLAPLHAPQSSKDLRGGGSGDPKEILYKYERALYDLRHTSAGTRNQSLYVAACRGGEVVATGLKHQADVEFELTTEGNVTGLTPAEVRQTIRSGLARGNSDFLEDK